MLAILLFDSPVEILELEFTEEVRSFHREILLLKNFTKYCQNVVMDRRMSDANLNKVFSCSVIGGTVSASGIFAKANISCYKTPPSEAR